MSQQTCGTLLLLALIVGISALAVFGPARKDVHWCELGAACNRIVMR